jgi:hypothetical protein
MIEYSDMLSNKILPVCCQSPLDTVEKTSVQKEKRKTIMNAMLTDGFKCKESKKKIQADKASKEEEIFFSKLIEEEDIILSLRFFPFHSYHLFIMQMWGAANKLMP